MLPEYEDIRALTEREPDWFDAAGVPRYAPFHPMMLGVYDHYAVLATIECQDCATPFLVGVGQPEHGLWAGEVQVHTLTSLASNFHYGDPPRHDCVGDTMNCEDIAIVQAWERDPSAEWHRVGDLEGPIAEGFGQ